jgi:hypothetical protein
MTLEELQKPNFNMSKMIIDYEKFSLEAKKGISLFKEWVSKIPIQNLENEDGGFVLTNICTSNHEVMDDDYRPDFRYLEDNSPDLDYTECCMYQLYDMVVSLGILENY